MRSLVFRAIMKSWTIDPEELVLQSNGSPVLRREQSQSGGEDTWVSVTWREYAESFKDGLWRHCVTIEIGLHSITRIGLRNLETPW